LENVPCHVDPGVATKVDAGKLLLKS